MLKAWNAKKSLTILTLLALNGPGWAAAFPLAVRMNGERLSFTDSSAPRQIALQIQAPDTDPLYARVLDKEDREVAHLRRMGPSDYVWDGHDASGRPVDPGIYILEVTEGPYSWSSAVAVER